MSKRTKGRRWLRVASVICFAAPGLVSACSDEEADTVDPAGSAGAGGAACPLPATPELPPPCVACIHTSCPSVYDALCAANCGAAELGEPCLSAQRQIGVCLQTNCHFECQATHG